jgi:polyene glycosyltransferase
VAVDSGAARAAERTDSLDVEDVVAELGRLLGDDSFRGRAELWSRRMR